MSEKSERREIKNFQNGKMRSSIELNSDIISSLLFSNALGLLSQLRQFSPENTGKQIKLFPCCFFEEREISSIIIKLKCERLKTT